MFGKSKAPKRELAFHQTEDFSGFRCQGCEWTAPLTRYWAKGEKPPQEVQSEFDSHDCKKTEP